MNRTGKRSVTAEGGQYSDRSRRAKAPSATDRYMGAPTDEDMARSPFRQEHRPKTLRRHRTKPLGSVTTQAGNVFVVAYPCGHWAPNEVCRFNCADWREAKEKAEVAS